MPCRPPSLRSDELVMVTGGSDELVTVTGESMSLLPSPAMGEGAPSRGEAAYGHSRPVLPPVRHAGTGRRRDGGADGSYLPIRDDLDVRALIVPPGRSGAPAAADHQRGNP